MIDKYRIIMREIFSYIDNAIELHKDTITITREVVSKYPTYIAFTSVDVSMQHELVEQLVEQSRYYKNKYSKDTSFSNKKKDISDEAIDTSQLI